MTGGTFSFSEADACQLSLKEIDRDFPWNYPTKPFLSNHLHMRGGVLPLPFDVPPSCPHASCLHAGLLTEEEIQAVLRSL